MDLLKHIIALSLLSKEQSFESNEPESESEDFFWHHIVPDLEDEESGQNSTCEGEDY